MMLPVVVYEVSGEAKSRLLPMPMLKDNAVIVVPLIVASLMKFVGVLTVMLSVTVEPLTVSVERTV